MMLAITLFLALVVSQGAALYKARQLQREGKPRGFWDADLAAWAGGAMILATLAGFLMLTPPWYKHYPINQLDAQVGKFLKAPKNRPDLKPTYVYIRLTFTFCVVAVVVGTVAQFTARTTSRRAG